MQRLAEKERLFRAYINKDYTGYLCFKWFGEDVDTWNLLTAALDVFGDTCFALLDFEEKGLGIEIGEKYIRLYGFLQAILLQQDAIKQLYRILTKNEFSVSGDKAWSKIRDLRHMATGHPLDKRGRPEEGHLRIFISQSTIIDTGFDLLICDEKTGNIRSQEVNLESLYEEYKAFALFCLSEVEKSLYSQLGPLSAEQMAAYGLNPGVS